MSKTAFSRSRLQRGHKVMAGYVARGTLPGYVSLISRRGEAHVASAGVLARDGNGPMQRDTIFRIASMTKPITAVAAMILVEECALRLDDPIDAFLPELVDRQVLVRPDAALHETVPADRAITLRDLLTFRLGYGYFFAPGEFPQQQAFEEKGLGFTPDPQGSPEPDEWMRRLGELPLMHQPGETWLYNAGTDVLGVLIARASGTSLPAFMQQRIFDPLGMVDTGFSVPAAKLPRLSTNYFTDPDTGALDLFDAGPTSRYAQPPTFPSGGAGLVSTVDDMHAFGQMLLGGGSHGGKMILSRPSVELRSPRGATGSTKRWDDLAGMGVSARPGTSIRGRRWSPSSSPRRRSPRRSCRTGCEISRQVPIRRFQPDVWGTRQGMEVMLVLRSTEV